VLSIHRGQRRSCCYSSKSRRSIIITTVRRLKAMAASLLMTVAKMILVKKIDFPLEETGIRENLKIFINRMKQ
jgi:hypothetical protein